MSSSRFFFTRIGLFALIPLLYWIGQGVASLGVAQGVVDAGCILIFCAVLFTALFRRS